MTDARPGRRAARRRSCASQKCDNLMEALEPRRLLNADLPFTYYYPEGYVHDGISEFVPITNTGDTEVRYELHARYEVGERDQLLAEGVIAPGTRGGVTINRAGSPSERLARPDTPYALVLRTSGPVGATMSHYDFGTAVGESFTEQTSIEWTFPGSLKDPARTRDFLVFYNPTDERVAVAVVVYTDDGQQIPMFTTLDPQRRGGWNINDEARIPNGVYALQVVASRPIVAALSHYELDAGRGFGAVGVPDGGGTAGFLGGVEFDAGNRGLADSVAPAGSVISILNTGQTEDAAVTLTFIPNSAQGDAGVFERTLTVPVRGRATLSVGEVGLPQGVEYGVIYRSSTPVSVSLIVNEGADGTGMSAVNAAATEWNFGEGFMSPPRAGAAVTEDLYLFNPGARETEATVEFFFSDGSRFRVTRTLASQELENVNIHDIPEVAQRGADAFYGIRVRADLPIVATFEHWDNDLGGGFSTPGSARGEVVPITTVPLA